MREDRYSNTEADAGRYDFVTFPQLGRPRTTVPATTRPPLRCGHERLMIDGRLTDNCARGRNCPNGGYTTHWPADGSCAACGGGS